MPPKRGVFIEDSPPRGIWKGDLYIPYSQIRRRIPGFWPNGVRLFLSPTDKIPYLRRKIPWVLLLLGLLWGGWATVTSQDKVISATVVSVHDGDTIRVRFSNKSTKSYPVRILKIDCFEVPSKTSGKQVRRQEKRFHLSRDEIYERGQKAREVLWNLLQATNFQVELHVSPSDEKDVYGRYLAHVFAHGKDVGETLLSTPYCFLYQDPRKFF